jgi:uncharacterized protein (DUF488 family)
MPTDVLTIGHSTLSEAAFVALLQQHGVKCVADIRRFPGSRKYPHFNRDHLNDTLSQAGIDYCWLELLGGRRGKQNLTVSPNTGLRNESFRNYADYMATEPFREGVDQLLALAREKPTAMMCSEAVYWRCHRRLVSDFLQANGIRVQHILSSAAPKPHTLTPGAVMDNGRVTYPSDSENATA